MTELHKLLSGVFACKWDRVGRGLKLGIPSPWDELSSDSAQQDRLQRTASPGGRLGENTELPSFRITPLSAAGSTKGFFFCVHYEDLLGTLEVKAIQAWGPLILGPLEFLPQHCPHGSPAAHQ